LRHIIFSSVIRSCVLVLGLSIGNFGLASGTIEFLNDPKVMTESEVDRPVAQSGCAALGGQELKSTNSSNANVIMYIGLGHLADGRAAEISLLESRITADSYTPDVLGFSMPDGRNGAELIRDDSVPARKISDGTPNGGYIARRLRQVKVPETLLDIVIISQWEYELRFYSPNQIGVKRGKLYEFSGEPFAVYRFRNPTPPAANRLEITTIKGGTTTDKSGFFYDAESESWSFSKNGKEVVKKTSKVNPHDLCERIETRIETKDAKVQKTVKIYKGFPWGQEIVKTIEDPDGEAKITIYKYFEDINGPHYRFLKTTIHPDGRVERHNEQPDPTMPFRKTPD
jgi:hypothetical protein